MTKRTISLAIVAVLLLCGAVWAWGPMVVGQGVSAPGGPSYVMRETWNGATEDNTWTGSGGTWDDDYTTSPAPLEGAQSLRISTSSRTTTFTEITGTAYIAEMVNLDNISATTYVMSLLDGATEFAYLGITTSGYMQLFYNNGAASITGNIAITPGSTYYLKVMYTVGTGLNAQYKMWISTDGQSWTQQGASVTNSSDTEVMDKFGLYGRLCVIDDIRVDDEDINY